MSKQRHDIGWLKRHSEPEPKTLRVNTDRLARQLVDRGLAPAIILGPMRTYFNKDSA